MAALKPRSADLKRRPKEPLIHIWAPKLSRVLVFSNRQHLYLAIILEANPNVSDYLERPYWPDDIEHQVSADFWFIHRGIETRINLSSEPQVAPAPSDERVVGVITTDDLLKHRHWIQN